MEKRVTGTWQRSATVIGAFMATMPVDAEIIRDEFKVVQAFFESMDETQCVSTIVSVTAVDGEGVFILPPGPPSSFGTEREARVTIFQFDSCTNTQLFDAFCVTPLANGEFQFAGPNLDFATLITTLDCLDNLSGIETEDAISVNLGWVGIGDPTRERFHFHVQDRNSDFLTNTTLGITSRSAEASGSVSDGVTNFTPDSTVEAFMSLQKARTVTID